MSSSKRLGASEWATIVTLYQRGERNVRELAAEFDVSPQAIHAGLKSRNIVKNSRLDEVTAESIDAARADRERRVQEANAFRDNYSKYADIIAKTTVKKILDAEKAGTLAAPNQTLLPRPAACTLTGFSDQPPPF